MDYKPRIQNSTKQKDNPSSVNGDAWVRDITGALTVQVILDYFLIWDRTRDLQLDENLMDRICWKWTSDRVFSTASAYRSFFIGQHPVEGAKLLRKTRAPGKCKFFIWLVIHDRCWTAARRKKHGLQDDDSCALCAQMPETVDHLLIACPFTREVWFRLLRRFDWVSLAPNAQSTFFVSWWSTARKQLSKDNRRCLDTLVILTSWLLWKEKNDRTFDRQVRTVHDVLARVYNEIVDWFQAGFRCLESVVCKLGRLSGRAIGIV